jgi:hypothetical protein
VTDKLNPILPKLAPLLRMLGSGADAEVVKAVSAMRALLDRADADFHDIVDALEKPATGLPMMSLPSFMTRLPLRLSRSPANAGRDSEKVRLSAGRLVGLGGDLALLSATRQGEIRGQREPIRQRHGRADGEAGMGAIGETSPVDPQHFQTIWRDHRQ